VNAHNGDMQDLGPGCMPSFSPDGKRIVFTQSGQGVMMMKSDGSNRRMIDGDGWGAQWSPDGKQIAYGKSGNVVVMDPDTRHERRLLTGERATRYSTIYWNLGWSHDSRWIAFKGQNRQTREYELAVANIDAANEFRVLYSTSGSLNADFTWSPDNRRVLFAMETPLARGSKLYWVDRAAPQAPKLFAGQPEDQMIFDCDWSPDGRRIVFCSQSLPQPEDWPIAIGK
jgi:Tol biopolymer transport system component